MVAALLMLRRAARVLRIAVRDEEFLPVFSAGVSLLVAGTLAYTLAESWSIVDSIYFSVATLTTTSVADPDLVLTSGWIKIFTVLYQLIGIGLLVEILRRLAHAFVEVRAEAQGAEDQ